MPTDFVDDTYWPQARRMKCPVARLDELLAHADDRPLDQYVGHSGNGECPYDKTE